MEPETKLFFRYPAIKITIKDLEESQYVEERDQNPNYILIRGGKKIIRINVMATIVHKEMRGFVTDFLVDDGTAKTTLRFFEENKTALDLEIGDVVLIVGRVRVYNKEKYIFPEIVKKINSLWLKTRSQEWPVKEKENENKDLSFVTESEEKILSEEIEENNPLLPVQKLIKLIVELDKGEGVSIEEIIEKSSLDKTEELLEKMLENGDIFNNAPGKVRVL